MHVPGAPMLAIEGKGLVSVGFDGHSQVSIYAGLKRIARLDRQPGDRWRMRKGGQDFDTIEAACQWLATGQGHQVRLFG